MAANSELHMQSSREGKIGIRHGKGEQRRVSKRMSLEVHGSMRVLPAQGLLSHVVSHYLAVARLARVAWPPSNRRFGDWASFTMRAS